MKKQILLLTFIFLAKIGFSQELLLKNLSFEGRAKVGEIPYPWISCGDRNESEPDTQPGFFDCTTKPHHGDTYIGMVVRDNDTQERISQKLSSPLEAGVTCSFTIWMAQSEHYLSRSPTTFRDANFTAPCILKVWSVNKNCKKIEQLAATNAVNHKDWKNYELIFTPKKTCTHVMLEVYYLDASVPSNGHILIDDMSNIFILAK